MASKNIFELLPDSDPETENVQDDKKPVKTEKKKEKAPAGSSQAQSKPKEGKTSGKIESKFLYYSSLSPERGQARWREAQEEGSRWQR